MDTVLKENMLNAIYNTLSLEDKIEALKPTVLKTFEPDTTSSKDKEVTWLHLDMYKICLTSVKSDSISTSKLQVCKYLKMTGIAGCLVEAKTICDEAEIGKTPIIGIADERIAHVIKRQLEELGATVELHYIAATPVMPSPLLSKVTEKISDTNQN